MAKDNSQNANLSVAEPADIKNELKQSIYINMWRNAQEKEDSDFAMELENSFKAQFGITLDYDIAFAPAFNFGFFGPGGHGKTSTVRSAVKEVCSELDLNQVQIGGLSRDYVPAPRDFIYGNINLGGSYSTSEFAIPQAVKNPGADGEQEDFLDRLGHRIFSLSRQTKGSMLLFDDVTNAQPNLVGPLLEITENKAFGSNCLSDATTICLTGNLAGDGSVGTLDKMGTPLHSRIKNFYVEDSPEKWMERWEQKVLKGKFSDEAKSYLMGMSALVSRAEGHFLEQNSFKNESVMGAGSLVNPRSLDNFGERSLLLAVKSHRAGMYKGKTLSDVLMTSVESSMGKQNANFISSFLESYLNEAQTLAARIIGADIDKETTQDSMKGTEVGRVVDLIADKLGGAKSESKSADAMAFSFQFGVAVSNELAIKALGELGKPEPNFNTIRDYAKKFAIAVGPLKPAQAANAIDAMVDKLVAVLPEQYVEPSSTVTSDRMVLQKDISVTIAEGFMASKNESIINKQTVDSLSSKYFGEAEKDDLIAASGADDFLSAGR